MRNSFKDKMTGESQGDGNKRIGNTGGYRRPDKNMRSFQHRENNVI